MKKFFVFVVMALAYSVVYAQGMYMLTEGWYGAYSGNVYMFSYGTNAFEEGTYKSVNDTQLGESGVNATQYGDRIYLVSKQTGSYGGGILTVADAKTTQLIKSFTLSDLSDDGHNYDGRSFCGVSDEIGYLGTSNGIFVIDLKNMQVVGLINGTDSSYGVGETIDGGWYACDVYLHQIGAMVRVGDYVFASQQNKGILVINANTHELEYTIKPEDVNPEFETFGDIVIDNNGLLWTTPGKYENWGWDHNPSLPYLICIDPYTWDNTLVIDIPDDIDPVKVSWSTYRAPMMQALKGSNRLVWRMSDDSDYNAGAPRICYYDIELDEFGVLADITNEGYMSMYSSLSVDVENDIVWTVGSTSTYGGDNALLGYKGTTGENVLNLPITQFSGYSDYMSTIFFTDDYEPEFKLDDEYVLQQNETKSLKLTDVISDKDNMDASIIIEVEMIENETIATATVLNGELIFAMNGIGATQVTLKANSNGKLVRKTISIVDDYTVAIENIKGENNAPIEYFNMQGVKVDNLECGVFIKRQGSKISKVAF